jgi:Fur family peroxide stress response transcriptional regulator
MVNNRGIKVRKRSRQRERILELLQGTGAHPTADWLYDRLKKEFPNLSVGTVYRNLNILVEQGLIERIDFGSTFDRFDAKMGAHYHFICEKCGAVVDLELPVDETLNRRVGESTPFMVKRHSIEFYGICDRCQSKEGQAKRG